ncbi:MAG: [protein-PII] uridylyltransferase [Alphaproteobacteria bacterium]
MTGVLKQRDIIDRKVLMSALEATQSAPTVVDRGQVLGLFKQALASGSAEVRSRFEIDGATGMQTVHAQSFLVDQLIRVLFDFIDTRIFPTPNPGPGDVISIVATGGYGRGELAPFSDIDLMFLLNPKAAPRTTKIIEYMLYMLWDLGLKVGHATRTVDEVVKLSKEDLTIRTSLLEARWLWGDKALFKRFKSKFTGSVVIGSGAAFITAKLAERDDRHERMGDTRYVLEPNIKEGKGGLRDLQTLYWIAKYSYLVEDVSGLVEKGVLTKRDVSRFAKAANFLWTVRCHLHYLAARPEERLTFNVQDDLAQRMKYSARPGARAVERFMKHYFLVAKDVGDLTRILCAVLESEQKKQRFRLPSLSFMRQNIDGFTVDGDRIGLADSDDLKQQPLKMLSLFAEAQRHGLDIHPNALRLVTQNLRLIDARLRNDPAANAVFLEMLTSKKDPRTTLNRMSEAGVLGRFIPDFGRVVAQMQYDMYHVYTVDEHTIRAIGIIARIESGELKDDHPVASSVIHEVQSRRVLYLAVLLHDVAKGRGGDHSELGGEVAERLCPRLGLNEWETETVAWLVRQHLLMSRSAFKREIEDQQTISDFVAVVQSPERLRLLLILTVADIRAVGPGVWNGWKASLLRELYYRTQEVLAGGVPGDRHKERVDRAKDAFRRALNDWSDDDIEAHIALGYDDYWLGYDTEAHVRHAGIIAKSTDKKMDIHIVTKIDREHDATEVIIHTHDHPGVFQRIAAAMALSSASIVDARIATMSDGMALDTFRIQDAGGGAFASTSGLKKLKARIEDALKGGLDPVKELAKVRSRAMPSRTHVFKVPPRVLIDNAVSAKYTVIELNGRDRLGFLGDITQALTDNGLQIASAHIATYGERVVDVFYVKDVFGLQIAHDSKIEAVRTALLAAIEPPE